MLWQDVTWEIPPDETDVEMPPVGGFGITLSFRRTADIEKLAAHAGALAGKTGEALIAAILELPDNGVTAIWREKNGRRVCGLAPIYHALLHARPDQRGTTGVVACYAQCPADEQPGRDTLGDESIVSIASLHFA